MFVVLSCIGWEQFLGLWLGLFLSLCGDSLWHLPFSLKAVSCGDSHIQNIFLSVNHKDPLNAYSVPGSVLGMGAVVNKTYIP